MTNKPQRPGQSFLQSSLPLHIKRMIQDHGLAGNDAAVSAITSLSPLFEDRMPEEETMAGLLHTLGHVPQWYGETGFSNPAEAPGYLYECIMARALDLDLAWLPKLSYPARQAISDLGMIRTNIQQLGSPVIDDVTRFLFLLEARERVQDFRQRLWLTPENRLVPEWQEEFDHITEGLKFLGQKEQGCLHNATLYLDAAQQSIWLRASMARYLYDLAPPLGSLSATDASQIKGRDLLRGADFTPTDKMRKAADIGLDYFVGIAGWENRLDALFSYYVRAVMPINRYTQMASEDFPEALALIPLLFQPAQDQDSRAYIEEVIGPDFLLVFDAFFQGEGIRPEDMDPHAVNSVKRMVQCMKIAEVSEVNLLTACSLGLQPHGKEFMEELHDVIQTAQFCTSGDPDLNKELNDLVYDAQRLYAAYQPYYKDIPALESRDAALQPVANNNNRQCRSRRPPGEPVYR